MRAALRIAPVVGLLLLAACGGDEDPYKPAPAYSGRKPNLPAPPTLNAAPIKTGSGDYTVAGAAHQLRSANHNKDVTAKAITFTGYIVQENISDAPACAVHKTGKEDKGDCKADIPSFWIADEKTAGKDTPKLRVLGFARNYAVVYDAMQKYNGLKEVKDPEKDLVKDDQWGAAVPFPIPAVGAKVKVTGKYGYSFSKSSSGDKVADPVYGVLTYEKLEVLEPAPEKTTFKNAGK